MALTMNLPMTKGAMLPLTSSRGHTLSNNTYAALNGHLTKTTYGNGGYIEYTYDNYDRITAKKGRKSIRG